MKPDHRKLIKPQRLRPGDTIGIVAPASPFEKKSLDRGISVLERMGYSVFLADALFSEKGYLAGDDESRAAQLLAMFQDTSIDAIMAARGGYGTMRLLPLLDWDIIAANPKAFVGFSDITVLLNVFYSMVGMVTFHGPMVTTLAAGGRQVRQGLQVALCTPQPLDLLLEEEGVVIQPGNAEGVLLGGNLSLLCHLLGTPYSPFYEDCILFLEDTGEALYRIDRMLTQMRLAGCLDAIAGVLIGSFKNCGDLREIYKLVGNLFDRPVPILGGLAAGHGKRNMTLPIGVRVHLDADRRRLSFLETATQQRTV